MAKATEYEAGDFVPFFSAGAHATGRYRCADCGYGITVHDELPTCPMCAGTSWEPISWARDSTLEYEYLL